MTVEIRLNEEGRKAVRNRHPWVYRDHVASGAATPGALVRVVDDRGRAVGIAAWSGRSKIALRFLEFGRDAVVPDEQELARRFARAVERRARLRDVTDAMRLVAAEADGFPGLIVDRYAGLAAISALTPFADQLASHVARWLRDAGVETVVARNDSPMRALEGLPREVRTLLGSEEADEVIVREHGLSLSARVRTGQKTGLFLDQRENRLELSRLIEPGDTVLDAFAYEGGFGLYAARRGARVLALDESQVALDRLASNARRNGLSDAVTVERGNAFQKLRALAREGRRFRVVVLDPPAFAKSRGDVSAALRGYREINARALRLVEPGGLLLTCSCSYQVQEHVFEDTVRRAAADANRSAWILRRGGQDVDHPVALSYPQSRYLKCLFLRMDDGGAAPQVDAVPRER